MKRVFDFTIACVGIVTLSPLFLLAAVLVRLSSPGPIFFCQDRIGRDFQPFKIIKFRTMVMNAQSCGPAITIGNDSRITRFGLFLRRTKIDELPQLFNVLLGEMSLVGPRPELPEYVEIFRSEYTEILSVRPGLTDIASLHYRDESSILATAHDPTKEYLTNVLPHKLRLSKEYLQSSSLWSDMFLIVSTIAILVCPHAVKPLGTDEANP
jgi:lipopolysaccharide/colanic/teichoic acid biosynthesis glycosyltransferase